ncbi:MAG: hypothetical protein ABI629_06340, partial [bacterium]
DGATGGCLDGCACDAPAARPRLLRAASAWRHRQHAASGAALLFATAAESTEHSWDSDPRAEPMAAAGG